MLKFGVINWNFIKFTFSDRLNKRQKYLLSEFPNVQTSFGTLWNKASCLDKKYEIFFSMVLLGFIVFFGHQYGLVTASVIANINSLVCIMFLQNEFLSTLKDLGFSCFCFTYLTHLSFNFISSSIQHQCKMWWRQKTNEIAHFVWQIYYKSALAKNLMSFLQVFVVACFVVF